MMAVQKPKKLLIVPQPPSEMKEFSVLFNPNTYTIEKPVPWSPPEPPGDELRKAMYVIVHRLTNAPALEYKGGASRTLTMELFFDVTEPIDGKVIKDVRDLTNQVRALTRIEGKLGVPPVVKLFWGDAPENSDFPFQCVVTNLKSTFNLFRSTGEPLRASLVTTFTEFLAVGEDLRETDPELTTRRVKRGDSLQSLAAEIYRDPRRWRVIAAANDLDDPLRLDIGRTLTIPKLLS